MAGYDKPHRKGLVKPFSRLNSHSHTDSATTYQPPQSPIHKSMFLEGRSTGSKSEYGDSDIIMVFIISG